MSAALAPLPENDVEAADTDNAVAALGPQIRALRQSRGLTLTQLAEAGGLSVGHLSQVERGLSTPTIRQLQAIGRVMGVKIGWFFAGAEERQAPDEAEIVRAGKRKSLTMPGFGLTDELLVPDLDGALELLLCTILPGGGCVERYTHEGEEAGLVLEGSLELAIDDRVSLLGAGDSFRFDSRRPHRYRNPGSVVTRIVWAITPPSY